MLCVDCCSSLYVDLPSSIFVLKEYFFPSQPNKMLKAPTVGKIKSKAVFCPDFLFHDILEQYLERDSPAIITFKHLFFPCSDPQVQVNKVRELVEGAKSHTSKMGALGLQCIHSKEIHTSFRVSVHLPTALLLDLQPVGKLRWWPPSGRGTGQNQLKLLSPLSHPGLEQRLGLFCEVCLGPGTPVPPGAWYYQEQMLLQTSLV